MANRYLTKSDFKVAQTCPTKLYYRKLGYPTREDGDEYLQALAEVAISSRRWPAPSSPTAAGWATATTSSRPSGTR